MSKCCLVEMFQKTKIQENLPSLNVYFLNHYSFLLFPGTRNVQKFSFGQRIFTMFLLGNYNKTILTPIIIYSYFCYSSHYFLNKGLMLQMLITGNFSSNYLTLVYFRKLFYIYQKRAGKGRGGNYTRTTLLVNQRTQSSFLLCS